MTPGLPEPERYPLHGFDFATKEERQKAAEGHPLWSAFLHWWNRRYDGAPNLDDSGERDIFEAFIEGGWQQQRIDDAQFASILRSK